ncbi:MAG: hypothetical protein A2583_10785 [Bdellovibrionales bacterium RIFOXYD1_FULL_53_11]|nr:MAG: hypothetical protein A2583_10785 [Bdellovibrionales bacterium RIFOXYD1_FULL_53_11]
MALDDNVVGAFCRTAMDAAFLICEPAAGRHFPAPAGGIVLAGMDYRGVRHRGRIEVAMERERCVEIAASMMGIENHDEDADSNAEDGIKELLNIAGSRIVEALHGATSGPFDYSVPETRMTDAAGWAALLGHEGSALLVSDDSPVVLVVKAA